MTAAADTSAPLPAWADEWHLNDETPDSPPYAARCFGSVAANGERLVIIEDDGLCGPQVYSPLLEMDVRLTPDEVRELAAALLAAADVLEEARA